MGLGQSPTHQIRQRAVPRHVWMRGDSHYGVGGPRRETALYTDLLDLYRRASEWCGEKVAGATALDAPTPCDEWTVRDLLNHILATQHYFAGWARGEDVSPPGPNPPELLSNNPVADFASARADVLQAFSQQGAIEETGPSLGIAFSDQLLHGWDLARATGQDATMPDRLPEAAYRAIYGMFTEEQRNGVFKAELPVQDDATAQERLLAYTGRPQDEGRLNSEL